MGWAQIRTQDLTWPQAIFYEPKKPKEFFVQARVSQTNIFYIYLRPDPKKPDPRTEKWTWPITTTNSVWVSFGSSRYCSVQVDKEFLWMLFLNRCFFLQKSYSVQGKPLSQSSSPQMRPLWHSWSKSQSPSPMSHFYSFVLQQVTSVLRAVHLGS